MTDFDFLIELTKFRMVDGISVTKSLNGKDHYTINSTFTKCRLYGELKQLQKFLKNAKQSWTFNLTV